MRSTTASLPLSDRLDPAARTYVVGLPVAVTVHDDGRVEYDVDTAEASCAIAQEDEQGVHVPEPVRMADVGRVSIAHVTAQAERLRRTARDLAAATADALDAAEVFTRTPPRSQPRPPRPPRPPSAPKARES